MKKAAMFGLDARIALAIFGALSVISGAALYSAIESAKVTQVVTELNEYSKAIEAYALDTGSLMPVKAHTILDLNELVTSSTTGWQGPYISQTVVDYPTYCTKCMISNSATAFTTVEQYVDNQAASNTWKIDTCTSGVGCTVWISLANEPYDFLSKIDEYVDGTTDRGKGNFRISGATTVFNGWYNTGINVDQLR
tara:strand:- start:3 stop:587 length:585 start_codon:yes stop_codon:yes gene_type:complete